MPTQVQSLQSAKERRLFALMVGVSVFGWLFVALLLNFYIPFIAVGVLIAQAMFIARFTGNGVRVSTRQLPDLHARVVKASEALGLASPPEVYVVQSGGVINAFATKLFSRRFVILYAEIIEACEAARKSRPEGGPDELDFVVAHEVGHLAASHLTWNTVFWPARVFPWLGPAYSRACEYTADACGHRFVGNLEVSSRALALLAAGGSLAGRLNLESFVEQRLDTGSFWLAVCELNASHPYLSKRIAALRNEDHPGSLAGVPRNLFAWILAPLFSLQIVGVAYIVFFIGVMAAIAIPNFVAMQVRAKRAEVPANVDGIRTAERAYMAAFDTYLACGSEEDARRLIGKEPRDWSSDPSAACFTQLGWMPDGKVRGGYWVVAGYTEDGEPAFEVYGISDVDGDGKTAVYRATPTMAARLETDVNLY